MTERPAGANTRPLMAVLAGLMVLVSACGDGGSSTGYTEVTSAPYPMSGESGPWFAVTEDAPQGAIVIGDEDAGFGLEEIVVDADVRSRLLAEIGGTEEGLLVSVDSGGDRYSVEGPLPNFLVAGPQCTTYVVAFVAPYGSERIRIATGLCGLERSSLGYEFTTDGVNIADRAFLQSTRPTSPPGMVGVDLVGQTHLPPGEVVGVSLDLLPLEDWEMVDPDLRDVVCFDVTVRSGEGEVVPGELVSGLDPRGWEDPLPTNDPFATLPGDRDLGPRVIPRIDVMQAGEVVPVEAPGDGFRRPFLPQPPGSTVVWSYGPIELADWQPDEITVSAVYGEIVDWDVSARRC